MLRQISPEPFSSDGQQPVDTLSIISYPGGGKGTNMRHIKALLDARKRQYEYFEVGEMVRGHFKRNTPQAKLFKENTPPGELVPDHLILPEIANGIAELKRECAWLFDGYPRNIPQIDSYVESVERFDRNDMILYLQLHQDPQVAAEIADRRLALRAEQTRAAGEIPREDDENPEARARRLIAARELYHVVDNLRSRMKNVVVIDGSLAIPQVAASIDEALLPMMFPKHRKVVQTGQRAAAC